VKKPKGPELKMPELKTPDFLTDLYYDLRDRRLLPFVALVVVAIAAVPFLLGGKSDEQEVPDSSGGLAALGSEKTSKLTVVEATPGLRDYHKRLGHRSPTNPFKQRYTGLPASAQLEGTQSGGEGSGSGGGSATVTETSTTEIVSGGGSGGSPSGDGTGGGGATGNAGTSKPPLSGRYFSYRPDIRFGLVGSHELTSHNDLPVGELLPKKDPVVIFLGVSENGQRVTFAMVDAASVTGPGRCIPEKLRCGVLVLHAGQAVNIVSGASGQVFRLAVDDVEFIEVDAPKPASSSSVGGAGWAKGFGQNFSK